MKRCESLAARTLLSIARQRKGLDAARCRLVFEHIDTALMLQASLHRTLARHRLSELQFAVLVVLFTLDPAPATATDLAVHTIVTRQAITEALAHLERLGAAARRRGRQDRRVIYVRITEPGRATVDEALVDYLRAAGRAARYVEPAVHPVLLALYLRLQEGATRHLD